MLERAAASGCPFLCGLRYAFRAGPWLVLALPLYSGGTLQLNLDERSGSGPLGGLPLDEVRFVAAQLTLALEAMHGMGMIHRDVKPSNAILDRRGYLVLTDFGLSGKIGSTSRSGTRGYWSPETVERRWQGEAADWWSFGVTVWYVACGRQPFHRRSRSAADGSATWEPLVPVAARPAGFVHAEGKGAAIVMSTDAAATVTATATATAGGAAGAAAVEAEEAKGAELDHPRHWRRRLSASELPAGIGEAEEASPLLEAEEAPSAEATGATAALRTRMTDEELNYNTLHMPIELPPLMGKPLADFIRRLLERSPERRLGSDGTGDVRRHAFLGTNIEWELLTKRRLMAPYVPNPQLVYTPDRIRDFSEEVTMPDDDELLDHFRDWAYDGEPLGYQEELMAFVQKSSTRQILRSMEAPAGVLAKLDPAAFSDRTHSERGSAGSDTQSAAAELWDAEFDNGEVDDYDSDQA